MSIDQAAAAIAERLERLGNAVDRLCNPYAATSVSHPRPRPDQCPSNTRLSLDEAAPRQTQSGPAIML